MYRGCSPTLHQSKKQVRESTCSNTTRQEMQSRSFNHARDKIELHSSYLRNATLATCLRTMATTYAETLTRLHHLCLPLSQSSWPPRAISFTKLFNLMHILPDWMIIQPVTLNHYPNYLFKSPFSFLDHPDPFLVAG